MENSGDFAGKSVLITGAGGGVGTALVQLFAARGARIVGCDLTLDAMQGDLFSARHAFDLGAPETLETAAQHIIATSGVPDIVINNAGWTRADTFEALDEGRISTEIDVNLTSVFDCVGAINGQARKRQLRLHLIDQFTHAFWQSGLCRSQGGYQCFCAGACG